jgi:serine phosphatase RsbU (regulator of sigma subunit)
MTIRNAILILVILVTFLTGIVVYSLSIYDKVDIYRSEFEKTTKAKLENVKFGIENYFLEGSYELLGRVVDVLQKDENILLSAVISEESGENILMVSIPDEDIAYSVDSLIAKCNKFNVEKDTVFRAIDWNANEESGMIIIGFSTNSLRESIESSSKSTLIQLAGLSFLSIIIGIFFSRRITKPIEKLKEVAANISSGKTDQRVGKILGNKDVKLLSKSFNSMLDKLSEMQKQRVDELSTYNKTLEYKNEQILSSIRYAKTIQNAILPKENILDLMNIENFILYEPKDIVSGDFYWFENVGQKVFIIVADCTGHGVPGAMISMMGNMILNDLILREKIFDPAKILERLDKDLVKALGQDSEESFSQDGMDISIIVFDSEKMKLEFAGASRPIYVVKNNGLTEIKGDRLHIGGFNKKKEKIFTNHIINIEEEQYFYLATDGFGDQIGTNGKKFGSKKLKRTLEKLDLPLNEQKHNLNKIINEHKGYQEQRDDITILGFKIL